MAFPYDQFGSALFNGNLSMSDFQREMDRQMERIKRKIYEQQVYAQSGIGIVPGYPVYIDKQSPVEKKHNRKLLLLINT